MCPVAPVQIVIMEDIGEERFGELRVALVPETSHHLRILIIETSSRFGNALG
jgi:hypothetical protein